MAEEKGIVINFIGRTVEFDKSVESMNKALKALKSEMTNINKKLKFDPSNAELLNQKLNNLKEQTKALNVQAGIYKDTLADLEKAGKAGTQEWLDTNKALGNVEATLEKVNKQIDILERTPTKLEVLQKRLDEIAKTLDTVGHKLEDVGKKMSLLSGAVAGLGALGLKYNAQLEQYQTALTTLLGTEEEAQRVMAQIQEDASKTPFDVESLTKANQLLISAGISADESRDVILALGDAISATGGGSAELSRMAQNLQQIKNVGKATAQDIKQFANAGINIYGLLADAMGTTTEKVKDMDISYEILADALQKASQEGGKYFGAMEKQSETINGSLSTLKDNFQQLLGELTKSLVPTVKKIIKFVTDLVNKLKGMDESQKELITKIGLFITALGPVLVILGKTLVFGGQVAGVVKDILPKLADLKGTLGGLLNPFTVIIGALALLYATNEDFRKSVNNLIKSLAKSLEPLLKTLGDILSYLFEELSTMLEPVINALGTFLATYLMPVLTSLVQSILPVLTGILDILFAVIKQIVDWIGKLWNYLKQRGVIDLVADAFRNVASVIANVVNWVKDLFNWFGSLISRAKEFLGLQSNLSGSRSAYDRGGGYRSGGYMSGGLTVYSTINVSNTGNTISAQEVMNWADAITQRVNDNLGRLV